MQTEQQSKENLTSARRLALRARGRSLIPTLRLVADEGRARGRDVGAERLHLRALAIKEKLLGPEHPDVGVTLNNLAVLCKARDRRLEAAAFYGRALMILEKSFGLEYPRVISCRNNFARLVRKTERSRPQKIRAGGNIAGSSATSFSGSQL